MQATYVDGTLNITPLTHQAFIELQADSSLTPEQAFTAVAGKLGITSAAAKSDVVTDAAAKAAMYEVLSAGKTGTGLPDGNYQVKFISFLSSDMDEEISGVTVGEASLENRVRTFDVTVSNGDITGSTDWTDETVTGHVQGTTFTMNMVSGDIDSGFTLNRLAGEISFGSASGTYNRFVTGSEALISGLFLATFTPEGITPEQTTALYEILANVSSGMHYFASRDVLIGGVAPYTAFGEINLSNLSAAGFDYSGFTNYTVTGNGSTTETWMGQSGSAVFLGGSRIFAFAIPYNMGDDEIFYVIGVPGNRKAIGVTHFVAADQIRSVVEVNLVRNTQIAPLIQPETTYNAIAAVAHMGLLTNQRTYNLDYTLQNVGQIVTPAFPGGVNAGYMLVGDENIIMSGSTLMLKRCANFALPLDPGDYIMGLEMYEGGAMGGTRVDGGTALEGVSMADYPSAVAIFMRKDGQTVSDFKGTLNFLSRTLYSLDYTYYDEDYAYGTINLDTVAGTAVLSAHNGIGEPVNANLSAEKIMGSGDVFSGMVHIYGDLGGDNGYVDIYWPVGGKRATYMTSDGADGTTFSVGETYLTF